MYMYIFNVICIPYKVVHEPKDPIRDINDTSHYSIEDAKRKEEHDRMMKAADEKKQQVTTILL